MTVHKPNPCKNITMSFSFSFSMHIASKKVREIHSKINNNNATNAAFFIIIFRLLHNFFPTPVMWQQANSEKK